MKKQEKIIWITGASSGIGEALATQWSKEGHFFILSARREEELLRVQNNCANPEKCRIVLLDLSNQKEIENAADTVLKQFGHVDILVNNGGVSQRSLVVDTLVEVDRKIMEINYFSGIILAKKLLPAMLARKSGHFVAISSIVGLFGFPLRSAYSAAKHALHGFYETLWAENHAKGIDITLACPGKIFTNISLNALTNTGKPYGIMDHGQESGITAERCAIKIIKAVNKKKKEVYIGKKEVWMIYIKRYIPFFYYKLVSKIKPT